MMTSHLPRAGTITSLGLGPLAIYLGMFTVTVDGSALNLALPQIGRDFNGSLSDVQWVVNAYVVPLASLLLLAGGLGDRLGAKRAFVISSAGFTVASLLCAISPTLSLLIIARVIQGIFGAGMLPMVLALVMKSIDDPLVRAKAVNLVAVFGGIALVVGPFAGGLLTNFVSWRWIFLVNAPIGAATIYLALKFLPDISRMPGGRADFAGQIMGMVGLTSLVGGLVEAGERGWSSTPAIALLTAGVAGIALFVAFESRVSEPVMPLSIFKNVQFAAASAGGFAFQFGAYGVQLMFALFVEQKWNLNPFAAAIVLLPYSVGAIVTTLLINPVLMRRGPRFMMLLGGGLALAGSAVAIWTGNDRETLVYLVLGNGLIGAGTGIYSPSLNQMAVGSVPRDAAGLASGVYNTFRQFGMAVGVSVLGVLAFTNVKIGIGLGGLCAVVILFIAVRIVPRRRSASRESAGRRI